MLRKFLLAAAALACLLAAASYFSPHWTIYRMRSAIEDRDYQAFSSHVDFPALRASFKTQLVPLNEGKDRSEPGNESFLESLGQGIAGAVLSPMIEAVVRPAGLIEMMIAGTPAITQAVLTSAFTQVPAAVGSVPEMTVEYRGWRTATFRGKNAVEADGSFVLERTGLWSWKLAAVELPR